MVEDIEVDEVADIMSDTVVGKEANMVLDMEDDKVADELDNMMVDMEVDMVSNRVADMVVDTKVDKVVDKPRGGGDHQRGSHSLSPKSSKSEADS